MVQSNTQGGGGVGVVVALHAWHRIPRPTHFPRLSCLRAPHARADAAVVCRALIAAPSSPPFPFAGRRPRCCYRRRGRVCLAAGPARPGGGVAASSCPAAPPRGRGSRSEQGVLRVLATFLESFWSLSLVALGLLAPPVVGRVPFSVLAALSSCALRPLLLGLLCALPRPFQAPPLPLLHSPAVFPLLSFLASPGLLGPPLIWTCHLRPSLSLLHFIFFLSPLCLHHAA